MSGRATGGRGLGRFVRRFDEDQTTPLFLRILPKKYHKDFQSAGIQEQTVHNMINDVFAGNDIRDDLKYYLDLPARFRFVHVKETKPMYEKLCKDYQKKHENVKQQVVAIVKQQIKTKQKVLQKQTTPQKKQQTKKIHLNCDCRQTK